MGNHQPQTDVSKLNVYKDTVYQYDRVDYPQKDIKDGVQAQGGLTAGLGMYSDVVYMSDLADCH
jgi:hypothetical protein